MPKDDRTLRYQVDIAPVNQELAAELVIHHLALAMGYFQAVPEGNELAELTTLARSRFQGFSIEEKAAIALLNSLCASYEELKELD